MMRPLMSWTDVAALLLLLMALPFAYVAWPVLTVRVFIGAVVLAGLAWLALAKAGE